MANHSLGTRINGWLHARVRNLVGKLSIEVEGVENARINRMVALGWVALIGYPMYYWMWKYIFPQPYETIYHRLVVMLLALPYFGARRWGKQSWYRFYVWAALTLQMPTFFVFMYLENNGNAVWSQSLLIVTVALFHFEARFATLSSIIGIVLGYLLFFYDRNGVAPITNEILVNIPILLFAIALVSITNISRRILQEQRLAGMASALGSVAHELRTPLASVSALTKGGKDMVPALIEFYRQHAHLADGTQKRILSERRLPMLVQMLDRIRSEVKHMSIIISLLLTNAGKPQSIDGSVAARETSSVRVRDIVLLAVDGFPYSTPQEREIVTISIDDGMVVHANPDLLRMIFVNMIKNSLRAIAQTGRNDGHSIIISGSANTLSIQDTGIGIAPERMHNVFTRFWSWPPNSGTGIGLAFCKETLASWDARITCESVEGAYTRFNMIFPDTGYN